MEFFCIIVLHYEIENGFLLASFGWSMTYQYSNWKNVKGIGLEGRKQCVRPGPMPKLSRTLQKLSIQSNFL